MGVSSISLQSNIRTFLLALIYKLPLSACLLPSGSDSRDLLLYDWQAEDLSAALPDQSGINKNKEE